MFLNPCLFHPREKTSAGMQEGDENVKGEGKTLSVEFQLNSETDCFSHPQ